MIVFLLGYFTVIVRRLCSVYRRCAYNVYQSWARNESCILSTRHIMIRYQRLIESKRHEHLRNLDPIVSTTAKYDEKRHAAKADSSFIHWTQIAWWYADFCNTATFLLISGKKVSNACDNPEAVQSDIQLSIAQSINPTRSAYFNSSISIIKMFPNVNSLDLVIRLLDLVSVDLAASLFRSWGLIFQRSW